MPARHQAARFAAVAAAGVAPLALTVLAAVPAAAHGSMTDPVSRVAGCFAEGPENPRSAACKAAVAVGGTQALYDWNGVNIADAAGRSKEIIPDGKLCSAGNDKFKGLDLARADWPATRLSSGNHTFRYKGTAPHKGSFELYVTKDGYDPAKPLTWSDLEPKPFLKVTDPELENGDYVFNGVVPVRSGRHLVYSIWQRSDSPEAFYTCSDVVFAEGGTGAQASAAPTASAPSDEEIADGADESSVEHGGHGDDDPRTQASVTAAAGTASEPGQDPDAGAGAGTKSGTGPLPGSGESTDAAAGTGSDAEPAGGPANLAETGGSDSTAYIAMGGAAALAVGAAALFASVRRRAAGSR
ncbi:chitin-binding protein [Streptomyces sp. V3I8]|uniref:lytic polysaccharide monooxygenase auxiliary activity family 9 protein n=1 Tax=Streptomyces sp. V3I8 TaxID=3042279 RepID=UPI00277D9BB7|nr:lytic polysaccharide monooxygenase [Streptomyces sp. V3I8]MDQ1039655.1 chitin-binding protein [Streptomyces sp. V3I8]